MKATPESIKAIETAIQIERDGLAFYNEAARQTSDSNGKRMFETLAADEAAHAKVFERAKESLEKDGEWLSPEEVTTISPDRFARPPIFPSGEELEAGEIPERELAALRRGIEAEDASITFYTEQMAKTADPDAKAMYAYLIEQEKGHRAILEGEYDYLTNTGFWFGIREFDLEGPS